MKDAQENVDEIDIPISDDEEEEFHENFRENEFEDENDIKTKSTSHAEQQPGDNSKNIVTNSSTVTNNSWGAFDLEGDDEIQSVKIRKEMPNEDTNKIESLPTNSARKNPVSSNKKRQIPLKEKSYAEILKRPKRATTLLETLLDPEIKKERYELLQCVHYVVSNNFFGVGGSNKNA